MRNCSTIVLAAGEGRRMRSSRPKVLHPIVGEPLIKHVLAAVGVAAAGSDVAVVIGPGADAASIKAAALTLLFTFTYFWVAWNRWNGADGRGLGWFCLFVAITTVPVFIETLTGAQTVWAYWFGLCLVAWGILWFLFFLILAQGRAELTTFTGYFCALQGIVTGWIPGYMLLSGTMPGGPVPH